MTQLVESPFADQRPSSSSDTAGSRALQQRENTQIMAMAMMAKRFPRDVIASTDKILNAFTRQSLAERASYQFSKGGTDVNGPSIRAAEAMAQMWGNLSMGFLEVSRSVGHDGVPFSEVEAFCWDMESTTYQRLQFFVRHWRDTKKGGYPMPAMRPKTAAQDLPPRMLRRVKVLKSGKEWVGYYYNGRDEAGQRKEIPLGTDLPAAKVKWAELESKPLPADVATMRHLFDRYARDVIPGKAPRTQTDNAAELAQLRTVFDTAPINAVTPAHVAQYRDNRGKKAKTRANRELALLSHVFNMGREWGLRTHENPVRGVRKHKETPRTFYADDATWNAVRDKGSIDVQDAMDVAYLTGQRPSDVLSMRWSAIKDGAITVRQGKTGKKLRILLKVAGQLTELGLVLERIRTRPGRAGSFFLIADEVGQPLKLRTFRSHFDTARELSAKANPKQADSINSLWFSDARSKAASDIESEHAQALLGHTKQQITETVYRRKGSTVMPTR